MHRIVLLGPPGTGKGTQAERVCARLGLRHFATGDLLRAAIAAESPLGKAAKERMSKGELVPDELVVGLIKDACQDSGNTNFILDGFPRKVSQAEILENLLQERNVPLTKVILLHSSDETLMDRLTSRRSCSGCSRVYNLKSHPSKIAFTCDVCGGALYQRNDDTPETIKKRIEIYGNETMPLVKFYEERGTLRRVDGEGEMQEIENNIMGAIEGT